MRPASCADKTLRTDLYASRYASAGPVDRLRGTLSGPATRKLCERAWHVFGDENFTRLANISSSHIYNHRVAKLLEQLRIEFTKSRARRCNDNALVESKNGSTCRRHLGYAHIPSRFAREVNDFTTQVLTPYLNFHRPCLFPETFTDAKGRQRKRYRYAAMMTSYDKLRSLPGSQDCLKPGTTLEQLDRRARKTSDNDVARDLSEARSKVFQTINNARSTAA